MRLFHLIGCQWSVLWLRSIDASIYFCAVIRQRDVMKFQVEDIRHWNALGSKSSSAVAYALDFYLRWSLPHIVLPQLSLLERGLFDEVVNRWQTIGTDLEKHHAGVGC